ncbi:hypothetical protein Tco_1087992 [Tanacetum coccineum]
MHLLVLSSMNKRIYVMSIVHYGGLWFGTPVKGRNTMQQDVTCPAPFGGVTEGLKSYNNDVKHGYVTPSLGKEDDEYLQLFEEEIEERLKHRD